MEQAFVSEMFPRANTDADREANRSAIWTRARLAVQGDKKPEAFNFQEAVSEKQTVGHGIRLCVHPLTLPNP